MMPKLNKIKPEKKLIATIMDVQPATEEPRKKCLITNTSADNMLRVATISPNVLISFSGKVELPMMMERKSLAFAGLAIGSQ